MLHLSCLFIFLIFFDMITFHLLEPVSVLEKLRRIQREIEGMAKDKEYEQKMCPGQTHRSKHSQQTSLEQMHHFSEREKTCF